MTTTLFAPPTTQPLTPPRDGESWSKDEDALMIRMVARGKSYAEVGARLGRSPKAIGLRMVRLRISARALRRVYGVKNPRRAA